MPIETSTNEQEAKGQGIAQAQGTGASANVETTIHEAPNRPGLYFKGVTGWSFAIVLCSVVFLVSNILFRSPIVTTWPMTSTAIALANTPTPTSTIMPTSASIIMPTPTPIVLPTLPTISTATSVFMLESTPTPTSAPAPTPSPPQIELPAGVSLFVFLNKSDLDVVIDIIGTISISEVVHSHSEQEFVLYPGRYEISGHSLDGQYHIETEKFNINAAEIYFVEFGDPSDNTPIMPILTPTIKSTSTVPKATPTVSLLSSPILLEPPDRASFGGVEAEITFRWLETNRRLKADEYYVLIIKHQKGKDFIWTKEPIYLIGKNKRWIIDYGPELQWQVVIAKQRTGGDNENPAGAEISSYSESRSLIWAR